MASRNNPYQRDPALAQAFNNIAGMFAPPSGSDAAGFATANAKRAEAQRLADLFAYSKDPNFDRGAFERQAVAAGLYNPTQSYYRVDQDNATTIRGQDVGAATARRGQDVSARTTLETNRLDNTRAGITSLYGALNPGQVRPAVPAEVGGLIGLPAIDTATGLPKPMSETEVKGAERQDLRGRGVLTDEVLLDAIVGEKAPVVTRDAQGRNVYSAPGAAARQGLQAGAAPSSAQPKMFTAILPDGKTQVPALQQPDGLYHAQTGEKLPPDVRLFNVPTPQGSAQDVGMGTTANKTKAQAIRAAVANSDRLISDLDGLIRNNPASAGLAANVLSFAQDAKQVVVELGQKFGSDPNAPISPNELTALTDRLLPKTEGYNPVYRDVRAKLLELAYANARMNNPSGEVSRFALEREIEALGLGSVGNDQSVLTVLQAATGRLKRGLAEADVLAGDAPAPTPETLFRPGGTTTPNAAPKPGTRMRFDANGNPL